MIAIIGMSVLLPGAPDLAAYWHNLCTGVDAITDVPEDRVDPVYFDPSGADDRVYTRRGGFVEAYVDVTRFGMMPASAEANEPDQLIALQVAAQAIDDAGGLDRLPDRDRVGVVLGRGGYITSGMAGVDAQLRGTEQVLQTLREVLPDISEHDLTKVKEAFRARTGPLRAESAFGMVPNLAASRIANRLDLHGPAYVVDAACASSLLAVDQAVTELASGRCDVMLAGGTHHSHDIFLWNGFSRLKALSRSGRIRPLHRDADGILIGEGTGVVVLKRLEDAERDGDRIYAVIRGTGVASDGRSGSIVNPEPAGQELAVRRAWRTAGLDPAEPGSVGLLEAHGTATPTGDEAELTTLQRVFGPPTDQRAVIGSVKSMIGHTMPAAGVASLVKAALAVYHGVLLPTLHCDAPHPALKHTRFHTIDTAQEWEGHRRAAVNAFGFGGINAHVVLEQGPSPKPAITVREPERVLLLSARTPRDMAKLLDADDSALRDTVTDEPGSRLGIVEPTAKNLGMARKAVARALPWQGRGDVWFSPDPLLRNGKLAFVFTGLEADFTPRVEDVAAHFGFPTPPTTHADISQHGAAVFGVGRLVDKALAKLGIRPDTVAGNSVGEWNAMLSAGILSTETADAFWDGEPFKAPDVAFAALGCGADKLPLGENIVLSHENSPNQSIVCGPPDEVEELVRNLRERNVFGQVLPFKSGFHTPMLDPFLAPLKTKITHTELNAPRLKIWSATTASPYPTTEAEIRSLFIRHLLEPVRFRSTIEAMYADDVKVFVQVGVGQLTSLIDDTLRGKPHMAVMANSPHRSGLDQLRRVATALWVEGGTPDFTKLHRTTHPRGMKLNMGAALIRLGDLAPRLAMKGAFPAVSAGKAPFIANPEVAAELEALMREMSAASEEVLKATGKAAPTRSTLRISTETMPYLLDHTLVRQRDGWPDVTDRRPVVPATTTLRHLMDAAEGSSGLKAVAVTDVRLLDWLVAAPETDAEIVVSPAGDQVDVTMVGWASATVSLAPEHSMAPELWPVPTEERPKLTAAQVYDKRWLFHGPLYQGIRFLTGISDTGIRAVLQGTPAPGSLLDAVGQLLACWMVERKPDRRIVFPMDIAQIRFFGDEPQGEVECALRITHLTDDEATFDAQVSAGGHVWAEITGWRDRRFHCAPEHEQAYYFTEIHTLAQPNGDGWWQVKEMWPTVASRNLYVRKYLSATERQDYERTSPRLQRQWLLGRIAAKDAVRAHLWERGWGPLFPAEITVRDNAFGHPVVTGTHGLTLPELELSIEQETPGFGNARVLVKEEAHD